MRTGIRQILEAAPGITVVAEAASGDETVAKVMSSAPDLVLLDITMPGTIATKCIEEILRVSPSTRVLVVTMHDDPLYLRAVLAAGAAGYVTKTAAPSTLIEAIGVVRTGGRYVAAPAAQREMECAPADSPMPVPADADDVDLGRNPDPGPDVDTRVSDLSQREAQVLTLIARGYSYQQIAEQLHISPNSVGTYRSRVALKLGIKSRVEFVRVALELGLTSDAS